jgi:hypothetical protein
MAMQSVRLYSLVGAVFVQGQSLKKLHARHLDYVYVWIRQHRLDMGNRLLAQIRSCTTERREKLQDDGIGREQSIFMLKRMIEGGHPLRPIIASQEESNPIERIGKETPHGYRFGKPWT